MGWMPQPKDKDWLNGYKNKTPINAVYKRPTSKQGTHTDWEWRAGKRYFMQMETKRNRSSNTHIKSNRLWNKGCEKRQRRTLYNDQRINPRRRYNNYICMQHRSTTICKANAKSMKGEIKSGTKIVGDVNTPLTPMDRWTKQKISKETQTLNDAMDHLDLIDIHRAFHPQTMNFTFFSSAHGTFSRIDHILGHKSSFGKFKKTEITPASFLITMQ